VKPAASDPYADLMAGVPELFPQQAGAGYDAMAGRISPETEAAIAPLVAEYGGNFHEPLQVRGAQVVQTTPELGSRALPPDPNEPGAA
jgi:hypothetical protein